MSVLAIYTYVHFNLLNYFFVLSFSFLFLRFHIHEEYMHFINDFPPWTQNQRNWMYKNSDPIIIYKEVKMKATN
jgi:hypothetical protein